MADQQFCLRWNEHTGTMVKVFKQMLDNQAFVDCTLACEGKLIKAHKMILAACSPYLHTILEENTSKHPIIFLPHLKYTDIRALVDYMYCGEVYISFGHLPSLLKAAEVLRIKGLTDVTNGSGNGNGTNISSSSDLQQHNQSSSSSAGDTSGTSSASNNLIDQTQLGATAAAAVAAAAAGHNLGQLLGNNLSNLLGAATNNNHHLDNEDCGSDPGNISNNKNTSVLLDQGYEDEENDYDLGLHSGLDQEVSFADDCSNEEQNNEDESINGESHSKYCRKRCEPVNFARCSSQLQLIDEITNCSYLSPTQSQTTDKTFLCQLCRCSFTAQSSLRRHMHRHYTDRERFECEICHNSYSRKDYLKEHKKTKHQLST
jgi:hypothetical protein